MAQNPNAPTPGRDPLHDPPEPPARDPPTKPLHDPPGDPSYEAPQPLASFRLGIVSSRRCAPQLPQERHLGGEQRQALEMLADAGLRGCTGATLLGNGFRIGMLADLVCDGLASGHRETMRVGGRKIKVARIRITDAGRRALEG